MNNLKNERLAIKSSEKLPGFTANELVSSFINYCQRKKCTIYSVVNTGKGVLKLEVYKPTPVGVEVGLILVRGPSRQQNTGGSLDFNFLVSSREWVVDAGDVNDVSGLKPVAFIYNEVHINEKKLPRSLNQTVVNSLQDGLETGENLKCLLTRGILHTGIHVPWTENSELFNKDDNDYFLSNFLKTLKY